MKAELVMKEVMKKKKMKSLKHSIKLVMIQFKHRNKTKMNEIKLTLYLLLKVMHYQELNLMQIEMLQIKLAIIQWILQVKIGKTL